MSSIFDKANSFDLPKVGMELAGLRNYPFFTQLSENTGTSVVINGEKYIMTGSNDYLSLSHDPRVKEAALSAINEVGTTCTGSRFLTGNRKLHETLEAELAAFLGFEAAMTFSAGYSASMSLLATLGGKGDIYFFDKENHASLYDGAGLSEATTHRFRHNDIDHLRTLLQRETARHPDAHKVIISDGVFSMNGQKALGQELAALALEFNAELIFDDAHAIGVTGKSGRGSITEFGLGDTVQAICGTFSKSFASVGGFIAASEPIIWWLRHHAKPYIFTAAMGPAQAAAALAAVRIMRDEPEHHAELVTKTQYYIKCMNQAGFDTLGSTTPIVPILVGGLIECTQLWQQLFDNKIFTTPAIPPSVPDGQCVIRTSINRLHTNEDIDMIVEKFYESGKAVGLVS